MWRRRLHARMRKSSRLSPWITVKVPEARRSSLLIKVWGDQLLFLRIPNCLHEPGSLSGFSALHEDIDSPRPSRRSELKHNPGSGREVPVVLSEDLSTSLSSLHDTMGRFGTDSSPTDPFKFPKSQKGMEPS